MTDTERNPSAFSPDQRDALYQAIEEEKDSLTWTYEALQEQMRELTLLLGWRFDSDITRAALSSRLNYATFLGFTWDGSEQTKLAAIESYMDAEASTNAVLQGLIKHLGLKEEDWVSES